MALAENLRQFRTEKGFTLEEIAQCADITRQAVSKYEKGKMLPNVETAVEIAEKLGVTCEELVKGKSET